MSQTLWKRFYSIWKLDFHNRPVGGSNPSRPTINKDSSVSSVKSNLGFAEIEFDMSISVKIVKIPVRPGPSVHRFLVFFPMSPNQRVQVEKDPVEGALSI